MGTQQIFQRWNKNFLTASEEHIQFESMACECQWSDNVAIGAFCENSKAMYK